MRRFLHLAVVASLVCIMTGQWAILQSIAWFGMAVKFSRSISLVAALEKTFDGRHPCKLCLVVAEGKKSEEKKPALKLQTRLEFIHYHEMVVLEPLHDFFVASQPPLLQTRPESPPVPPPRAA